MLKAQREPILVIANGEPRAVVRRDEKTRSVTFYKLETMSLEDIEKLLNRENEDEVK